MQTYQAGKYNFRRISCVFAIFVVPSRGTDIAFGNPTSKLRSRNAAHTTVHSFFFKNPFAPVIPLCCLLASELSVSNKVE